jgi:hypothetical protein
MNNRIVKVSVKVGRILKLTEKTWSASGILAVESGVEHPET